MKYRLAIFDLDGTLSDSFPWFLRVMSSVAKRHGLRQPKLADIERLRGKTSREIIAWFGAPAWRLPLIARDMRRLKAQSLDDIPLFPGVPLMLSDLLDHGMTLAVVSSDSEANVKQALGLTAPFITHFDCGASLFGKARKFKRVMRLAGVPAAAAIAIGDEMRDAEAAKEAGIDFAAVSWGYATVEALARTKPVVIFERVNEIPAWLA